jgi:hypothetical protein
LIVSSNIIVISLTALYFSHRSCCRRAIRCKRKNIDTSWDEILATGCIPAPPKASNLFRGVACRTAFHFVLDVDFCVGDAELLFVAVAVEVDFETECLVLACAEPA